MLTINPSYDPAKLNVSKPEIIEYLKAVYIRMKNNPKVPKFVKARFWADIKLIETFETEEQLKYHVSLMLEIVDGIRSIVERKNKPELVKLNELHRERVLKNILTPPEASEFDAMKILAQAKASLKFGAMH